MVFGFVQNDVVVTTTLWLVYLLCYPGSKDSPRRWCVSDLRSCVSPRRLSWEHLLPHSVILAKLLRAFMPRWTNVGCTNFSVRLGDADLRSCVSPRRWSWEHLLPLSVILAKLLRAFMPRWTNVGCTNFSVRLGDADLRSCVSPRRWSWVRERHRSSEAPIPCPKTGNRRMPIRQAVSRICSHAEADRWKSACPQAWHRILNVGKMNFKLNHDGCELRVKLRNSRGWTQHPSHTRSRSARRWLAAAD